MLQPQQLHSSRNPSKDIYKSLFATPVVEILFDPRYFHSFLVYSDHGRESTGRSTAKCEIRPIQVGASRFVTPLIHF